MLRKIVIVIAVCFLNGCATIIRGDSQYLDIHTCPVGATVKMGNNIFTSPARVLLKKGLPASEYSFIVKAKGYKDGYATIRQKLSPFLWGNIIFGLFPGLLVDFITGAAYDLYPNPVIVSLQDCSEITTQTVLPGPPLVLNPPAETAQPIP